MYSPAYAIQSDPAENERIIRENSFATIVYDNDAYHLPLLIEGNKLIGHMAKANPAWKALHGKHALFIFHGPHQYISPTFYGTDANVPTWNYISVHVRGEATIREDETFLKKAIVDLSKKYDPTFDIEKNITDHKKLFASIVGIEVLIKEISGKFKLAQSKPEDERRNVIKAIAEINPSLAEEMKRTLKSDR
jgi:transcriptional regulator